MKFDHLTATQILHEIKFGEFRQSKNVIFGNFRDSKLWILVFLELESCSNQNWEPLKWPKMTFLDRLNSPKFDFTQKQSGGRIVKFQQSQALTSHFESFWSIVNGLKACSLLVHFEDVPQFVPHSSCSHCLIWNQET